MRRIRSKGMQPEMEVRRLAHRLGYRYRLHVTKLPGKPDLVFPSRRKIILVHGCFWHQHRDRACKIARTPKSNLSYWEQKLRGNVSRDAQYAKRLRKDGWELLTVWECQTHNRAYLAQQISTFLG